AAEAYARIAAAARDVHAKARAVQAEAGCRLKAGNKEAAIARLTELANDPALRKAAKSQGALIGPNAQLLILKWASAASVAPSLVAAPLLDGNSNGGGPPASRFDKLTATSIDSQALSLSKDGGPTTELRKQTLESLVVRLNDYTDADFP